MGPGIAELVAAVAAPRERIHRSSDALAASDVEHMVNPHPVRERLNGYIPRGVASLVDPRVSAKLSGTL